MLTLAVPLLAAGTPEIILIIIIIFKHTHKSDTEFVEQRAASYRLWAF